MSSPISDPAILAAIQRTQRTSASEPSSDRFRLQLDQELRSVGVTLAADELDAVQQAIVQGRF